MCVCLILIFPYLSKKRTNAKLKLIMCEIDKRKHRFHNDKCGHISLFFNMFHLSWSFFNQPTAWCHYWCFSYSVTMQQCPKYDCYCWNCRYISLLKCWWVSILKSHIPTLDVEYIFLSFDWWCSQNSICIYNVRVRKLWHIQMCCTLSTRV